MKSWWIGTVCIRLQMSSPHCSFCDESIHPLSPPHSLGQHFPMEKYTLAQKHLTQHTECLTRWLNYTQLTISWMTSRDCQDATEVAFMHVTFFSTWRKDWPQMSKWYWGKNILCLSSFRWGLNRGPAPPSHQWSHSTSYKSEGVNLSQFSSFRILCVLVTQSCPTLRPHGLEPARLLCRWDSPGKNTAVGCRIFYFHE